MDKRQTLLQLAGALSEGRTKLHRARLWLALRLLDGPAYACSVLEEGAIQGFSQTTLRRAARGVVRHRKVFMHSAWLWELHPRLESLGVNESREELERRLLELCE